MHRMHFNFLEAKNNSDFTIQNLELWGLKILFIENLRFLKNLIFFVKENLRSEIFLMFWNGPSSIFCHPKDVTNIFRISCSRRNTHTEGLSTNTSNLKVATAVERISAISHTSFDLRSHVSVYIYICYRIDHLFCICLSLPLSRDRTCILYV